MFFVLLFLKGIAFRDIYGPVYAAASVAATGAEITLIPGNSGS